MSGRQLEGWIDSFLFYTDNTEPPELYRKWVAISAVASVLQRKCRLNWGTETFFPNMYIVLVGPPAARKGTAMKAGREFLNNLGISVSADESSRQKLVKSLQEAITTDQTPQGDIDYHSSMTIFSSELTVFLGYEGKELLSTLCKWYDCEDRFIYDTHQRGKEEVTNVWVNLLGATTPGQLQAALPAGAVGSGFTSRVVFVYAENKGKVVLKPTLTEEQVKTGDLLINDLGRMRTMGGEFIPTGAYEDLYYSWRENAESKDIFHDARLDYYVQRRPTHLFKLSIIFAASRSDDNVLDRIDLERAIETLEEAEKKMQQVFVGVGANPLAGLQDQIVQLVKRKGKVPMQEVAETFANDAGFNQLSEAIAAIEQMGQVKVDPVNRVLHYNNRK